MWICVEGRGELLRPTTFFVQCFVVVVCSVFGVRLGFPPVSGEKRQPVAGDKRSYDTSYVVLILVFIVQKRIYDL